MKVFAILILAVAAVYASGGEDGDGDYDHKQVEKKECKFKDAGCFKVDVEFISDTDILHDLHKEFEDSIIYPSYVTNDLFKHDKKECCSFCQHKDKDKKFQYFCLTIWQDWYYDNIIVPPNTICKCRTDIQDLKKDDNCISEYGVAYLNPSDFKFRFTQNCFRIEDDAIEPSTISG